MADVTCRGCLERDGRIAALEARVAELEALVRDLTARLGTNASNSSLPPSANPPGAERPVAKKKTGRRPGGQPGHPPRLKQLLPPGRVTDAVGLVPDRCGHCRAELPAEAGPADPQPKRFQVADLPPLACLVTEYRAHARTCPCCGRLAEAAVPAQVRAHSVGPRLTAVLSYLTGCHGLSKRAAEEVAEAVFAAPVALGTVANLEQEVSAAVAAAHAEALEAVRAAEVKFADETGRKLRGRLCWLWMAAAAGVAAFVVHAGRGAVALAAVLGEPVEGILHSDRWHAYLAVPAERRQVCWAHLKRDFRKVLDRGGAGAAVGRRGLRLVKGVFAAWHRFREGRAARDELRAQVGPLRRRMQRLLVEGLVGDDTRLARFCETVLALEEALWTFAEAEGVEPTNNFGERLRRRAVLWRKRSFGCAGESGCRFVERILTVVQTCRLRGRDVLEYLQEAVRAHRSGLPCPSLLAQR